MNKEDKEKLISVISKLLASLEELSSGNYYNLNHDVIREISGWHDYYRSREHLFKILLANEELFELYGFKIRKNGENNFDLLYNGKLVLA